MFFAKNRRTITRLLVVEDEPLIAFDTEHLLRDSGYAVVATVDRVSDALSRIDAEEPLDLVLLDVALADGSGVDVAWEAHERGIAVLFVTGQCPAGGEEVASGCLAKPYAQRDLLDAIDAIDATRAGRRPRRVPGGLRLFGTSAA